MFSGPLDSNSISAQVSHDGPWISSEKPGLFASFPALFTGCTIAHRVLIGSRSCHDGSTVASKS